MSPLPLTRSSMFLKRVIGCCPFFICRSTLRSAAGEAGPLKRGVRRFSPAPTEIQFEAAPLEATTDRATRCSRQHHPCAGRRSPSQVSDGLSRLGSVEIDL